MKILLAYSGGLDTSAILLWLKNKFNAQVTCYCCDLGNNPDVKLIKSRAKEYGADDIIIEDQQGYFLEKFAFPMLKSGALYQNKYLLGTAIARPVIAERMAQIAIEGGFDALSHGATGKGNDQLRFELAWARLCPEKKVIAPWKEWEFKGRNDLMAYLKENGFEYQGESGGKYSIDENIFHKSTEGSELENIVEPFDPSTILDSAGVAQKSEKTEITMKFENGVPKEFNGQTVEPVSLMYTLNEIGTQHEIGVVDLIENRVNGIKSRGVYQTPGASIIKFALDKLKEATWGKDVNKTSWYMADQFADLIYQGLWHSNAAQAIKAYFDEAGKTLTGEVSFILSGSNMYCKSIKSDYMLYSKTLVSFEEDGFGINEASVGYCKTLSLQMYQEGLIK